MVIGKKPDSNNNSLVDSVSSVNILLICISLLSFQQIVNASCLFTDGQIGECIKFEECQTAITLSRKGVNPAFCNLEERTVCCADYKSSQGGSRKQSSQASSSTSKDTFENDPNIQRKKHSVGSGSTGKRKTNAEIIEEPYKYESNTFYTDDNRRTSRPNEESYFVPPGLAKKKSWREEKTTENDYYYERVTKKPGRDPSRKGSNKHTGYESNNSRKWGDSSPTRPEWSDGSKGTSGDWYSSQNEYENNYYNQRTTTRRNNWGQETYTTTKRPDHFGGKDEYYNIKPTRRPQPPSRPSNANRPSSQGNKRPNNQGNKRPNNQEGSNSEGNRPNYQQRPSEGNRPSYQQGNYFENNRPSYEQGNNYENNRPNYQQGNNFENNRPNYQQGTSFEGNGPDHQQGSNFGGSRPDYHQGSGFDGSRPTSRPRPQEGRRRISERKCEEYSKQITENITGLPLTTNPDPVTIPVRKCITPQQLIVGGENTTLGEFPHMAAIGFRDRNKKQIAWNCGGTLISEQFVLTAAHCTSTSSGRPVKVRLGEYNLMKNDDGAYPVDYAIVDIITHPDYKPPSKYNDIALLKLSRKVTFFKHIRPACLYSEETFSASKAIATGWGRMYYDGGTSEILQKVVLSIVDNYTCNRLYKVNVKTEVLARGIVDSQLCAGELTGGKDTCQGDSGGPLSITNTKCIHHIIGITSFGKSCALPNSTGVYTRVSAYVPWIESIVWP